MSILTKKDNLSIIVGLRVKELRIQSGLTIEGLAFALSISISYTLMIERGDANISTKLAKKIADFFDINVSHLYTSKRISLKSALKKKSISRFYAENKNNVKFFIYRRNEYSTSSFIKNVLLEDNFLTTPRAVSEIRLYSLQHYQRELNSQEVSRELRRLYQKGILERTDKFGNKSIYCYNIKV